MITKPMLLDETGQKIKAAIVRVKNKFLGVSSDPITPGSAASSGIAAVIQDDTGREIIAALNDLGSAVKPASLTEQGLVSIDDQTFAGMKDFPDGLKVGNYLSSYADGTGGRGMRLSYDGGQTWTAYAYTGRNTTQGITVPSRWIFTIYSYSSATGEPLSTTESYRLPVCPANLADSASYDIWTSKTIPPPPSANGTYTLKATVSNGTTTYSWV